jgi:hypothetical protein
MLELILIVFLICLCVGSLPSWPHSQNWGPGPSGGLGLVLVIFLVWILFFHGRL